MEDFSKIQWPGWETVRLIGRGSFGAVYEIQRDLYGSREKAALKHIRLPQNASDVNELRNDGYDDESISSTFQSHLQSIVAEYALMRKLNGCTNVVNCDDVQIFERTEEFGWDIYIKMELLTPLGQTLPDSVPEETVVRVAKDLCAALVLCRKNNIIHRDIKPQNIFVSDNGDYKLGDFGIAKTVEKTMGGTKTGTYKYMAPEVYHEKPYGHSADIYSLGLVLYWMLNRKRMPFVNPGEKLTASIEEAAKNRRLAGEPLPAPASGSRGLQRIVLKACSFDPKDRYHSADEMLADLERLNAAPVAVPQESETGNEKVADAKSQIEPEHSDAEMPRKKKKLPLILAAVCGVLALALILILSIGGESTTPPSSAPVNIADNGTADDSADSRSPSTDVPDAEAAEAFVKLGQISWNGCTPKDTTADGHVIYKDADGKYGMIDPITGEGTGAKYCVLWVLEGTNYVVFSEKEKAEQTGQAQNHYGLMRSDGKVMLSAEYARIDFYNKAVVIAYTSTELASENNYMFKSRDDAYCNGFWLAYSLKNEAVIVEKQSAGSPGSLLRGDVIQFSDVAFLPSGERIPADAVLLDNGSYLIREPAIGTVYRSDGTEAFSYDPNEVSIESCVSGYRSVQIKSDGSKIYTLLDANGKAVSGPLNVPAEAIGPYLTYDFGLYSADAKYLSEFKTSEVMLDKENSLMKVTWKGSGWTIYDLKGNAVLTGDGTNTILSSSIYGAAPYNKNTKQYYSFKDKAYSISGNLLSDSNGLVVCPGSGGMYNLLDPVKGETLLQGYENYVACGCDYSYLASSRYVFDGTYYILASYGNGTKTDVYRISPKQ